MEALPQLMVLVSLSRTSTHISPLDALEVLRLARPRASPQPSPYPVRRAGGRYKESQRRQSIKYGKRERKNKKNF